MWNALRLINQNLILAIPLTMLAGFGFGLLYDTASLKTLIVPFTFVMVYPMMVSLKIKQVFEGGDTRAQVLTQAINFGIIPFVAYGLGLLFFRNEPYLALGLLLAGLVPTSGMTISWTGFARGNVAAAVKMTVIGLTLGSLATPFYVKFLMGTAIEVSVAAVLKQIALIVLLPMFFGYFTQQALVRTYGLSTFQQRWAPRFPALSTIGVIGIVFIAIALKARGIAAAPAVLLYILMPLVLIYGVNYVLSTLIGRWLLPRGDAIALVYGSVMRNLSIALAIAINAFGAQGSSTALVIAIAYIIQVQSAAWYVRLTDRFFGPPMTAAVAEKDSDQSVAARPKPPLRVREKASRRTLQYFLAALVPLVIVGGYFFPYLGYLALAMMLTMMVLMFFWGRWYCGWLCAMGAFHERITARISLNREMPPLFKQTWFRWLFFVLLMGLMTTRLAMSGGSPSRIGAVFVMMWTVATALAIAFGIYFKPRAWCNFCPMGSMQGVLAPKTYLLKVGPECKACGLCEKVCPIQTYPGAYRKQGTVPSLECMRCENCVLNCPKKALSLPPAVLKTAMITQPAKVD